MVKFGGGIPRHTFPQAFVVMAFECAEGCCKERIWNSRDGAVPNVIMNRRTKHPMSWQKGRGDLYAPSFFPKPGMRVFTDATPALVRPTATMWVEEKWANLPAFRNNFKDKDAAISGVIKDWCQNGQPWIATIEPEHKLLNMKAGDTFPFICPQCGQTTPYDADLETVSCICGFIGTTAEFSETSFEIQTWVN
jgi:hypothetical protein